MDPKIKLSSLPPETIQKLLDIEKRSPANQQLQVLSDIALMVQELISVADETKADTAEQMKALGAVLTDAREQLVAINKKETPKSPDYAKPVVEAISKLEKTIGKIDVRPNVTIEKPDAPVVNVGAPSVDVVVDTKEISRILKEDIPSAFREAISSIPETVIPEAPDRWDEVIDWLESIDTASRMKPTAPTEVRVTNPDGSLVGGVGSNGNITDGVSSSIKATVLDLASSNPLTVAITDGSGGQITSFGGGTQYTEGDVDTAIAGTAMLWEDTGDTLRAVSSTKPLPVDIKNTSIAVTDGAGSLTVDGSVSITGAVDTEMPVAAALNDNDSNPTAPTLGAALMLFDGTTWDRGRNVAATGDAQTGNAMAVGNFLYNGTNWNRGRSALDGTNTVGTGIAAVTPTLQFDDVSPTSITENQFGHQRMSANRNAYTTIRDAAGNERGVNVTAGNALTVDGSATTQPVSAASLPLPTGASTSALQTTGNTSLSSIDTKTPALGQNTMANSQPVAIASNQTAIPITDNSGSLTVDAPVGTPVFVRLSDGTSAIATLPVSIAATVTTKETRSSTNTTSTVAGSATVVTLLASNANRLGATVYNDSSAILYLKLGAAASTSDFTAVLAPLTSSVGGYYEVPFGYTGIITGIWASATGSARVGELT